MPTRSAQVDCILASISPPCWARSRQLCGRIIRRIPPDGNRIGRFGHRWDQKSHRQFGPRLRRRSRADAEAPRLRNDARRRRASTVHLPYHRGNNHEAFAWDKGEGDRTRERWLDAHRRISPGKRAGKDASSTTMSLPCSSVSRSCGRAMSRI